MQSCGHDNHTPRIQGRSKKEGKESMRKDTSYYNSGDNSADVYDQLLPSVQRAVCKWISLVIQPAKKEKDYSSYGLKHIFEYDSQIYVSNGEFKGAMKSCGYDPTNPQDLNWVFKIKRTCFFHRWGPRHRFDHYHHGVEFCFCHCSDAEVADFRELCQIAIFAEEEQLKEMRGQREEQL